MTGIELATGKIIKQPSIFVKQTKEQKIPGEPLVTLAILSSLIGLGISFIKAKKSAIRLKPLQRIAPAGSGIAGLILLSKSAIKNLIM